VSTGSKRGGDSHQPALGEEPEFDDGRPGAHQTITRVTRLLEEVVYRPGLTHAELTRALGAPKSSVYGFIRGLLAVDWLFEQDHRLYLGPAFFSLAIASGEIRAGLVSPGELDELSREAQLTAFVGIRAGDHLLYIAESGSSLMTAFEARTNIRRNLLNTAGGKVLLAATPEAELESYLRRRTPEERDQVRAFITECPMIRENGYAVNINTERSRVGLATAIHNSAGTTIAAVTLVGPSSNVLPRIEQLSRLLIERVGGWRDRAGSAREPI
jgi:DNA-binding IclR family transcriptional regulator